MFDSSAQLAQVSKKKSSHLANNGSILLEQGLLSGGETRLDNILRFDQSLPPKESQLHSPAFARFFSPQPLSHLAKLSIFATTRPYYQARLEILWFCTKHILKQPNDETKNSQLARTRTWNHFRIHISVNVLQCLTNLNINIRSFQWLKQLMF